MSSLLEFLAERDISNLTEEVNISNRLPEKFKIKALTKAKHTEFTNRCKKLMTKEGMAFDNAKFQTLVCLECCIYPNFSNAEFIEKLKVATPADAIGKALLPGEEAELYTQICKLSGFDNNINEEVEEAKN